MQNPQLSWQCNVKCILIQYYGCCFSLFEVCISTLVVIHVVYLQKRSSMFNVNIFSFRLNYSFNLFSSLRNSIGIIHFQKLHGISANLVNHAGRITQVLPSWRKSSSESISIKNVRNERVLQCTVCGKLNVSDDFWCFIKKKIACT